eukprot:m.504242 g.504242  ORF g.504242 m.504242 type:complete len:339 (-) comp21857_c2_seq4:756-1772(-)
MDTILKEIDAANLPPFEIPTEPREPILKVLRTPDYYFDNLPGFNFNPNYINSKQHGNIRIHYLDEGPKDAKETILLMHGEPTWCYLYRYMIPKFVDAGFRVVAPDLVGFGRSDKPSERTDYSYERQIDWMSDVVVDANIHNCTPFLQDWGGLIGLRLIARYPERFSRIVVSNTGLPMGDNGGKNTAGTAFQIWASVISQQVPDWGKIIQSGCNRKLSEDERNAYDAPYPSEQYKAAPRTYPQLVPQFDQHPSVEENKGAFRRVLSKWNRPLLTLFGSDDAITAGGERMFKENCPGARLPGVEHAILHANHFIQEDAGAEIVSRMLQFIKTFPLTSSKI